MIGQLPQAPAVPPVATVTEPWYHALQNLGWIDLTALSVLAVFFVLGLFKGFVWQVSRVAILVVAYVVAGRFGADLGAQLAHLMGSPAPTAEQQETSIYLAYVAIFLAVLIVLSLLALLLQKLVKRAGMTFFDRLGGGVVGVATGGAVVLFLLGVVLMFFQNSNLAEAATQSRSRQLSQQAIDFFGKVVPDEMRKVFGLTPLNQPLPGEPLPGQPLPGQPMEGQPIEGQRVPGALPGNGPAVPAGKPGEHGGTGKQPPPVATPGAGPTPQKGN